MIITNTQGTGTPSVYSSKDPVKPGGTGFIEFKWPATHATNTTQHIFVHTNIDDSVIVLTVTLQVIENASFQDEVSGKVTDVYGIPLPYVSVAVEGTNNGTRTDINGVYKLKASTNEILVFDLIGMETRKIAVDGNEINIKLQESYDKLDSVLPYEEHHDKNNVSFASVTVSAKDLKNANNPKYNFKRNAKKDVFIIYIPDENGLTPSDLAFQTKYSTYYLKNENMMRNI